MPHDLIGKNGQPKLLIVYASYGDGHLQAARAVRDALERQSSCQVVMLDLMAESHPWLNEMTRIFYQKSYTRLPKLYGWMYGMTRPMKHDSMFGTLLHAFGREKIRRILEKEQPDAVIHTFPFYALPSLGKRSRSLRPIPCYSVITDFDLHRRWLHPHIDRYYVAAEDIKKEMIRLGIPGPRIAATGIPIKSGFRQQEVTPLLHRKYGINPELPAVLMLAGAQGVMPSALRLCEQLLAASGKLQMIMICGRNTALREAAEARFHASHPDAARFRAFGYVEQIHELMSLSSCIITKPGALHCPKRLPPACRYLRTVPSPARNGATLNIWPPKARQPLRQAPASWSGKLQSCWMTRKSWSKPAGRYFSCRRLTRRNILRMIF
ncbi:diacylglycerol glucosyltransferase [Paenibacillus protaetiae]|uniref:Diacylglycerol glucosyltransferase n=1 Tax=Paenibacillus protaetiae TaxID=2509456 RepID=A0A4P6EWY1_9BACL|nr:diacylglycerol glucosyltransferase [Paenibacillus protaetiae]QAY67145.1 diacylglycerol glucosyltransferase [Paenibacillus protaetiae]